MNTQKEINYINWIAQNGLEPLDSIARRLATIVTNDRDINYITWLAEAGLADYSEIKQRLAATVANFGL